MKVQNSPTLKNILIVDDDSAFAGDLITAFQDTYRLIHAIDVKGSFAVLREEQPDLILLDVKLPDISGLELLTMFRQRFENVPVIMLTGESDLRSVISAMKSGAFDYVTKGGLDLYEELSIRIEQALERKRIQGRSLKMEAKIKQSQNNFEMIGDSVPMLHLKREVERIKGSNASVLITGENGTGKELVARGIHAQEEDSLERPFVVVSQRPAHVQRDLIRDVVKGITITGPDTAKVQYFQSPREEGLFPDFSNLMFSEDSADSDSAHSLSGVRTGFKVVEVMPL